MIFCMPRSTVVLFLPVVAGALALPANAQTCGANAKAPIATDRPQITSSSIVVPCGSLQFENGFQETSNEGQRPMISPRQRCDSESPGQDRASLHRPGLLLQ